MNLAIPQPLSHALAGSRPDRPRLGFLGLGWIGRHRLEAVVRENCAEIAALAEPQPELARQAAELAPRAARVSSLDDLLAVELDGVVIATPSALHAEQAMRALRQNLAVFCQKPLGRTASETAQVIRAARQADRLLGVDLSYRHIGEVQQVREVVRGGELGEIYAVDLVFHNAYGPDKAWFYDRQLSGGGCVIDLGIHLVDLAFWMLGFPKVTAVSSRLYQEGRPLGAEPGQVEDFATARLDFETGASAQLACSWRLPAGEDAVIGASFYGTRGGARVSNVQGSFYNFKAERFRGTAREPLGETPQAWGGRALVEWTRKLRAGRRFDPDIEGLIPVSETLDRIYRAGDGHA